MLLTLISVVSTPTHSVATDLALSLGNWATNLATNQRRGLCASTGQLIQPLIPISRSIYQHYNSVLDSSKLHSSTNAEKNHRPPPGILEDGITPDLAHLRTITVYIATNWVTMKNIPRDSSLSESKIIQLAVDWTPHWT